MTLSTALEKYYKHFGMNYPLLIVDCRDEKEIIADIEQCVSSDCPAKEIEYDECDY